MANDQLRARMAAMLRPYGLEELTDWAVTQFQNGASEDEIFTSLREQPAFKQKYRAIFEREAKGLPPISVQDILNYQQKALELEHLYQLPPGFIDVNTLMVKSVSMDELAARVENKQRYIDSRPDIVQEMRDLYGLNAGDALAFALDPETGLAAVQRRFSSAAVAARAQQQGFGQLSAAEAEQLVGQGVTEQQADQGFSTLNQFHEVTQQLVGEAIPAMSREEQLGVVAGTAGSRQELQRRAEQRAAVFDENFALASNREGLSGAGSAR